MVSSTIEVQNISRCSILVFLAFHAEKGRVEHPIRKTPAIPCLPSTNWPPNFQAVCDTAGVE